MLDCIVCNYFKMKDNRGEFHKPFEIDFIPDKNFQLEECFYSESDKNVVRGMHYQSQPYAHNKIVFVTNGKILDVVLCIDKDNKNYGKFSSIELSESNGKSLYIPVGYAHGFLSLEDNTKVVYLTDKKYDKLHDRGILWSSFGFNWPTGNPIISDRDKTHDRFLDVKEAFK